MSNPSLCQIKIRVYLLDTPVPDADLELKGGLVIQTPQIRGEPGLQTKFLFGLKIRGGAGSSGPFLGSATPSIEAPLEWVRVSLI